MFNIGDNVKEKGKSKRVLEVINKIDDVLILKELNTDSLNIITFNENQIELNIEEVSKVEKTNRISRISGSGKESIIEYDIEENEICFNISKNPINLSTVLKILLHETELFNYKYERVSPFKLNRKYDGDEQGHIFTLNFIEIRTFEIQTVELLKTDRCMNVLGSLRMFIPDFLELCVERNILQRVDNGYKVIKKLHEPMEYCTYLKSKPSIRQLEKEGFIIPDKWDLYA